MSFERISPHHVERDLKVVRVIIDLINLNIPMLRDILTAMSEHVVAPAVSLKDPFRKVCGVVG